MSKVGNFNIMENQETTSPTKQCERTINGDSEHVSKIVHQFYFVKLCPTDPDSITKIRKEENFIKKINQDICEITKKITKKTSEGEYLNSVLKYLNYPQSERRNRMASNEKIVGDLYMTLDELNLMNKVANGEWFVEKLDKNSLNYLKLHGSKSLAEEKKILRDVKIQQKVVASFKSPSHLINSSLSFIIYKISYKQGGIEFCWNIENLEHIRRNYCLSDWQKLMIEIELFKIQHMERASGNDSVKANISNYESLKKRIEDKIKLLCDNSLKDRREWMECGSKSRHDVKELEAINRELCSLRAKLTKKHKKKDEAYQRILKFKNLYHKEIIHYYHHCWVIYKFNQLAEKKDVAALDEMSRSEIGKFMLEWNNNKAFREDYEKKVLNSLERRQLSGDGRRKPNKSCNIMLM